MKSICWAFFIAILLVSCAPMGQNIINRQTKADTSGRKTESFLPFKQVRPLSRETVTAVKDLEGNIWLIEEKAVYLYEKGKLLEAGSSANYRGRALNALGAAKGAYIFYSEAINSQEDTFPARQKIIADSVRYFDGKRYLEVFHGQADPNNGFVDSKGRLWICRKENKITVINGLKMSEFIYTTKINQGTSKSQKEHIKLPLKFYEDTKGKIWIWSDYQKRSLLDDTEFIDGFLCCDNEELFALPFATKANDEVAGILELPSGEFLVSFYAGGSWLFELKRSSGNIPVLAPKGTSISIIKNYIITDSLRTGDGRIIVIAGNKMTANAYNIYYSIFLVTYGKIELLKNNIESGLSLRFEGSYTRELCEDASGAVWISGDKFQALKISKDGSIKEYGWSDGLIQPLVKTILRDRELVYLFAAPERGYAYPREWYSYDSSINSDKYKTGWELFNSLCIPVFDANSDVWFVSDSDGWLTKYRPNVNEKVLNVFEEVKIIRQNDRLLNPELLGICKGVENDIWVLVAGADVWVIKYKDGTVKEEKLKDIYSKLAAEKAWNRLNMSGIRKINTVFSDDGHIVMADYHFNRKLYFFNKVSWELLESKDINGENGLEISDPAGYKGESIVVTLRDRVTGLERRYMLVDGKWQLLDKKIAALYSSDYTRAERRTLETGDGTVFEFSEGNISVRNFDGRKANITVKNQFRSEEMFVANRALWFILKPQVWNERKDFLINNSVYPVCKCDYWLFLESIQAGVLRPPEAKRPGMDAQPQAGIPVFPAANIDSLETAYKYLLSGLIEDNREAEKYFIKAGANGREYLKKMLQKEKDQRILWKIEALLSKYQ